MLLLLQLYVPTSAMPLDPRAVQIRTDGSAFRNLGHVSGCAVIARYPDHVDSPDEIIVDFGCPRSKSSHKS